MLIKQIDGLNFEPFKRALNCLLDVFRTAIKTGLFSVLNVEAELGGNDNSVSLGSERFAYQLLVREWAVDLCGIKESNATFDSGMNQFGHLILI